MISISEFLGFGWAYLIAAVAATGLITWYCRYFLGGGVRTLMIGAGLGGVYTFLYITLRQQDYALLMGSIALFLVLGLVMFVTRRVDWYARDATSSGSPFFGSGGIGAVRSACMCPERFSLTRRTGSGNGLDRLRRGVPVLAAPPSVSSPTCLSFERCF